MSKPKRRSHEQKAEYGANKSTPQEPAIRVGNRDREYLIRTDMREATRLTGQWRDREQRYHLFINHAGPHIEALVALVENGASGKDSDKPRDLVRLRERVVRLGGDADVSDRGTYHLFFHDPADPLDDSLACGRLTIAKGAWIELEFDASAPTQGDEARAKLAKLGRSSAKRFGEAPNLLLEQLDPHVHEEGIRSQLWFPPTPRQVARLPGFIFGARIRANAENYLLKDNANETFGYVDLVYAYYTTAANAELSHGVKRQRLQNIAEALDRAAWQAYQDALTHPAVDGGIDEFHQPYWCEATLQSLSDSSVKVAGQNDPKSLLTHTRDILDASPGASLRNFERLLYLQRRVGGHYYAAELEVISADANSDKVAKVFKKLPKKAAKKLKDRFLKRLHAGGMLGLLTLKKQDDPAQNPKADEVSPDWLAYYAVELGGLKLSQSAGGGGALIISKGEAKNVYGRAWQPEQLGGRAALIDVGASISGGGAGKGGSLTLLRLWGSGSGKPDSPLQIDFSGLADVFALVPGAEVSFSRFVGWAHWLGSVSTDIELPPAPPDEPFDYGGKAKGAPLHFPINGAGLFPDGERLLQTFAATHLAVLGGRGTKLEIHGHADQPHDAFHNMILSRNRAITVFHYLKNILGDDLAARDFKAEPPSEDEEAVARENAKQQGKNYDVFIPQSPNVSIIAHGEPTPEDDDKSQREYDVAHRRVELNVIGVTKLGLKRTNDRRN